MYIFGQHRERDETLARVAALEARRRRHENIRLDPRALHILIDELRRGLEADHPTVRDTLQRIVARVEVKKNGGTLYLRVPLGAVLSVGTPGAVPNKGPRTGVCGSEPAQSKK